MHYSKLLEDNTEYLGDFGCLNDFVDTTPESKNQKVRFHENFNFFVKDTVKRPKRQGTK